MLSVSRRGGGGGGGFAPSLQKAYNKSNTIVVTAARGSVQISDATDTKDLLYLERTNTGGGRALVVSMGAATTGHAVELDTATGGTGYQLRGLRNQAQTWAIDADGRAVFGGTGAPGTAAFLEVYRATGSILQARTVGSAIFEVNATAFAARTHAGVSMLVQGVSGSGGGIRDGLAAAGASTATGGVVFGNGRRFDTGAVGTDTYTGTSGTMSHLHMVSSWTPASGTREGAELHINPTLNGTSSAAFHALLIAPVITAWTGGTVNLLNIGTSTTDGFTGFTSLFAVRSTGDFVLGSTTAAATALPQGTVSAIRTVQTTDATVTTIATIPTGSDKSYVVRALAVGKRVTGTNETGAYEAIATFENDAGTLAQVSTDTQPHVKEDTAGWDLTINPSGTNILVQVTGAAGSTVDWKSLIEVVEV